jgi:hypothetical protein
MGPSFALDILRNFEYFRWPLFMPSPKPVHDLSQLILELRGHRVILDSDLAALYEVPTKRLNEQVKRNADRFPLEFAFQLAGK